MSACADVANKVPDGYVPRVADVLINDQLAAFPAVLLVGPRAVGKTLTAVRQDKAVVRLDRPDEAGAFSRGC